jgi:putative ABC transport system substrate-binding protein
MRRREFIAGLGVSAAAWPHALPVEQSTRIEMVLNLRTAKALGIEVPPKVVVLADRIIE